jgi:hypothetical protein
VGISRGTYYRWYNLGKEGNPTYKQFYLDVNKHESALEQKLVNSLITLACGDVDLPPDFRALKLLLERRYPDNWYDKQAIQVALNKQAKEFIDTLNSTLPEEEVIKVLNHHPEVANIVEDEL